MDFQIGDIVQFKSLDLDYVSKDTWERIGGIDDLDSRYSLEHDYEVISITRNYLGIRSDGGVTFDIPKEYFKLIATRGFRIGDRIKTLEAFPNGGSVLKDEIGTIVGWSPALHGENVPRAIIDFPSHYYYAEITNSEKYTKVIFDYEDVVEIEEKVLKPGDYIEALVDNPSGGSISKGEVGVITSATHTGTSTSCVINFKSHKNYLHTVQYSEKLKIARITKEEYESKRGIIKESEGSPLLFLDDALTKPKSNTSITQGVVSLPPKTKRKPTIEIIPTEGVKI